MGAHPSVTVVLFLVPIRKSAV